MILPEHAVDAQSLIAQSDLVISAGGTMNREAVALGVPVYTTYGGRMGGVDEALIRSGRLRPLTEPRRNRAAKARHGRPAHATRSAVAGRPRARDDRAPALTDLDARSARAVRASGGCVRGDARRLRRPRGRRGAARPRSADRRRVAAGLLAAARRRGGGDPGVLRTAGPLSRGRGSAGPARSSTCTSSGPSPRARSTGWGTCSATSSRRCTSTRRRDRPRPAGGPRRRAAAARGTSSAAT